MHNLWVRTICGGLETRIRYSNVLGYNTFPVPAVPHFLSANEGGNLRATGVSETDSRLLGSAGSHADDNPAADSQVDSGPGSGFLWV